MSSPWSGDWRARVRARAIGLGFASLVDFVHKRPGVPFGQLALELGDHVAPAQVQRTYLADCAATGSLRAAAAECLARKVVEEFPRGWGVGVRIDYRIAGIIAHWVTDLTERVERAELDGEALMAIGLALRDDVAPPLGWIPKSGTDPLIQQAFQIGLDRSQPRQFAE